MNGHSPVSQAAFERKRCANFAGVTISCADLLVQCPLLHGDQVHAILKDALTKSCVWPKGARYPGFRLDTWRRR